VRRAAGLIALACAGPPAEPSGAGGPDSPGAEPPAIVDQRSYTAACEALLGEIGTLRCADGDLVPVEVTTDAGTHIAASSAELEDGFRCDQPSGLSRCTPGSRAQVGQTSRGVPWVLVCRQYADHPDDPDHYDQIGLIASDPQTGDTCYWSTPQDGLRRGDPVPAPGSEQDVSWTTRSFWYTLDELRDAPCTQCHDNDPWIHTPWIHRMNIPSAPTTPQRLVGADILGWELPAQLVHPDAAPCLACHTLAAGRSCELAQDAAGHKSWQLPVSRAFNTWPRSHWMEGFDTDDLAARYADAEAWDATWGAAVTAIDACCRGEDDGRCWAR